MAVKMTHVVTAGELLDGHSVLDFECRDRIYLIAYVPILQSSGQVVAFMTQHLGNGVKNAPRCLRCSGESPVNTAAS